MITRGSFLWSPDTCQMFDAFLWLESRKLVLLMVPYEPPNRESSRDLHCPRRWKDLMTSPPGRLPMRKKGGGEFQVCQSWLQGIGEEPSCKAEKFRKDPAIVLAAVQRKPEATIHPGVLQELCTKSNQMCVIGLVFSYMPKKIMYKKKKIYISTAYIYVCLYKEAYMYMKMIMWVFCLHFLENAIVYRIYIYIVYCIVNTYLMSVYSYMDYPARPCGMRLRTAKITGHVGSFQDKILVLDMWIRDRRISGLNFEIHPNADLTYLFIIWCLTSNTSAQPAICKSKCNMKLFKGPHQLDVNTI